MPDSLSAMLCKVKPIGYARMRQLLDRIETQLRQILRDLSLQSDPLPGNQPAVRAKVLMTLTEGQIANLSAVISSKIRRPTGRPSGLSFDEAFCALSSYLERTVLLNVNLHGVERLRLGRLLAEISQHV